mmetsp:Transcript_63447/g.194026  ORF Transcript_63447/g.194026 Transcript_63447/m.194026 type:complete len:222 (-) Transcript_63447:165-830(-)
MVASNSIQSPWLSDATSLFRSSPNSSAMSGWSPCRVLKRGGYILTIITLFVRTTIKTSKPSRMTATSPCHLNVRRRKRSSKARAVDGRWDSDADVRGPQSKRKSSHVSMDGAPLCSSCVVLICTVDRKKYTAPMMPTRPKRIATYFLASTTAQPPILQVITSDRNVGRLMRDFLSITLRQRGQWWTTSLKAGHNRGSTQNAIHPRLIQTTNASSHVTQEAS